jgi:hypothetical protein
MQWIVVRYLKNGKEWKSEPMFADEAEIIYQATKAKYPKSRVAVRKAA